MAEYKILEYDYGFFVENYVGNYKLFEYNNKIYIVSDEYFGKDDIKKELKLKEIFVDEYKEDQYIIMKLSKIDVKKDNQIIEFCNMYGLPYSSAIISENKEENISVRRLYDYMEEYDHPHPFFHHDCMLRSEFCKYVVNAKNYLMLLSELKNKTPDMKKLICSLLYVLIFERIWDKCFNDLEEHINYTFTGKLRLNFQYEEYDTLHSGSVDKILKALSELCKHTSKESGELRNYYDDLADLISKLMFYIKKNGYSFKIDENYDITSENEFEYNYELKQIICKIGPRVLADSITEGISNVRQVLDINPEKNKFRAIHKFRYMYEGIYQELFLLCTNGERIHKCQNVTCSKYFVSNTNKKKFCSHQCAATVAKRRQRERDKADPNRKRQEPGFKGKTVKCK